MIHIEQTIDTLVEDMKIFGNFDLLAIYTLKNGAPYFIDFDFYKQIHINHFKTYQPHMPSFENEKIEQMKASELLDILICQRNRLHQTQDR